MRLCIAAGVALAAGFVAGGLAGWSVASSHAAEIDSMKSENATLTTALAKAQERAAQLESEVATLQARSTAAPETGPSEELKQDDTKSMAGLFEDLAEAMSAPAAPSEAPGKANPSTSPTEEVRRRAEWEQRRQEYAARIRDRVGTFLQAEMDATGDPQTQARLEAMGEYVDYYMELRAALRAAETEAEKEEVRASLSQATQTMQDLLREQQDVILRGVLEEQGVTGSEKQEAFIAALRHAQSNPFFRGPFPMAGVR